MNNVYVFDNTHAMWDANFVHYPVETTIDIVSVAGEDHGNPRYAPQK